MMYMMIEDDIVMTVTLQLYNEGMCRVSAIQWYNLILIPIIILLKWISINSINCNNKSNYYINNKYN